MAKRWVFHSKSNSDVVQQLAKSINVSVPVAELLVKRGINTFDEAKSFFRPSFSDLHDPFIMKDMQKAIDRIEHALSINEKILIYGDYDVDGTTSAALVTSYLHQLTSAIDFYIPDRYSEGYGISFQSIDFAADNNISLIIALDCGIKANDKVNYALEKGIDFIICDHHLPGAELPLAKAILNPKQSDCPYPYKELSGCGIGFKLIQALDSHFGLNNDLTIYLDMVATSIAADIVPLTGENRTLAYFGLKRINTSPRPGIFQLLSSKIRVKAHEGNEPESPELPEISISDLVFTAAPRINAAGRIEHGKLAVNLLLAADSIRAEEIYTMVNEKNDRRREFDSNMTQQALSMVENNNWYAQSKSTVIFHPEWHKGVIGIVASRLIEKHYKPTIVLTESNGKVTGSARSVKDFDIHEAIESCSHLLEQYGGHKFAAGLTMKTELVNDFRLAFESYVEKHILPEQLIPSQEIDLEISLSAITPNFYKILNQFAPFGPGNMAPVFVARNLTADPATLRLVGSNHLKIRVKQENSIWFDGIAFQQGQHIDKIQKNFPFDIAFSIEENIYNGKTTLQLNIKDIKFEAE
jgi:single-stranded-DNA-specific exonuclease